MEQQHSPDGAGKFCEVGRSDCSVLGSVSSEKNPIQ